MSTQTHDEALHPRGAAGRFANKDVSEAAGGMDTLDLQPPPEPEAPAYAFKPAVKHYGTPVMDLEEPLITTDVDGKTVKITGFWDNSQDNSWGVWVHATGQKQKKDGTFYGGFKNMAVPIPKHVRDAFQAFNEPAATETEDRA